MNIFSGYKKLFIALLIVVFCSSASAAETSKQSVKPLKRDGFLRLYHSHSDQFLEVQYEIDGVVQDEQLEKINEFMRSRDSGKKIPMNLGLIRMLDHIQDHFKADTVEVISGYRSPEFNRYLKESGKSVAENSHHMKGLAADIHLDEITEKKLQAYARKLKKGGVGYYPDFLMVHLDMSKTGYWREGVFSNRLNIGIFNEELDLALKTNRLFYFPGNKQRLVVSNPSGLALNQELELDWFFRGKWHSIAVINNLADKLKKADQHGAKIFFTIKVAREQKVTAKNKRSLGSPLKIPYGKFRWKIKTKDGQVQYSNEFYLKRR